MLSLLVASPAGVIERSLREGHGCRGQRCARTLKTPGKGCKAQTTSGGPIAICTLFTTGELAFEQVCPNARPINVDLLSSGDGEQGLAGGHNRFDAHCTSATLSSCGGFRHSFPTKTVTATAAPSTTPTRSRQDTIRAWHNAALVPLQEIHDAADKIVKAAEAFDLITMGIACQEQHDAVEQVQQHMPSPDPT